MKNMKVIAGCLIIFLSGILAGAVIGGMIMKHKMESIFHEGPPAFKRLILKKLSGELKLTKAQQEAIEPIVEKAHADLKQLRHRHQPEAEKIIEAAISDMKQKLTEGQRKELDLFYGGVKKRWHDR
ncbi:hypothetical protein [Candidatus Magnetominusculus xianensis]|uniref:Periplasmic heavy metal sensor n=1 Tax=Candidatus Magnetominusculus xianensis TaxID=1748249 RepID=A0ABR5SHD6_9BACT|nr:hypothetical protein [Candidatus Magnetominusculus xianensis]KWT91085.1 hypothetical protein ASN18_0909 [Candidatus Magnetominusculus xianensis]MBF0403270.1 hypothetical protein [Nitrospirota bacterium]